LCIRLVAFVAATTRVRDLWGRAVKISTVGGRVVAWTRVVESRCVLLRAIDSGRTRTTPPETVRIS
jgi:hypothetical protein